MNRDFSLILLLSGLALPLILGYGAILAYWRRRWAVSIGFLLMGLNSVVFSFTSANAEVPETLVTFASLLRIPAVALVVFGFVVNQPKRARRPARWTP